MPFMPGRSVEEESHDCPSVGHVGMFALSSYVSGPHRCGCLKQHTCMLSQLLWVRSLGTALLVLCSGLLQRLEWSAGCSQVIGRVDLRLRVELKPASLLAVPEGCS